MTWPARLAIAANLVVVLPLAVVTGAHTSDPHTAAAWLVVGVQSATLAYVVAKGAR
jgi:hypothetical protein